jgi:glutaredoxin 3
LVSEIKKVLRHYEVPFAVVYVDKCAKERPIRKALEKISGVGTLPLLFISGRPIAGRDELLNLDDTGELGELLAAALGSKHDGSEEDEERARKAAEEAAARAKASADSRRSLDEGDRWIYEYPVIWDDNDKDAKGQLARLLQLHPVLLFSKTWCPFCLELKRTLTSYGTKFGVVEVDACSDPNVVLNVLFDVHGRRTVPLLFVEGKCYGGCADIKHLEHTGDLTILVAPYVGLKVNRGYRIQEMGLLFYPETVNARVAWLTTLLNFVFAILCVIFYRKAAVPWAVLAIAIDYCLRLWFGVSASLIGMISTVLSHRWISPIFTPGPPKQFTAVFALLLAVFAAGLFLGGREVGGAVVTALLAFYLFMEMVGLDIGSRVFMRLVMYKIISPDVYRSYLNFVENRKWSYEFSAKTMDLEPATKQRILLPSQTANHSVDLIVKSRWETEYKERDFHLVKHCRIDLYLWPMGLAMLALVFQTTQLGSRYNSVLTWDTGFAQQVIGIISVILFGAITSLYLVRMVLCWSKVSKEWHHEVFGNYFSAPAICLMLYGIMYLNKELEGGYMGGIALIWIGAVLQLVVSVSRMSALIFNSVSEEVLNASTVFPAIGNFIAAIGFATYKTDYSGVDLDGTMNYVFIGRLWFAVGALTAVIMLSVTLQRAIFDPNSDRRLRYLLWIWLGAAALFGPAYLAVSEYDVDVARGVLFQTLYCISLFLFAVLSNGWITGFFDYVPDLSIWFSSFAYSAIAFNTATYYSAVGDEFFFVLTVIATTIAAVSTAVCGLHSCKWLIDWTLFKPRPKWGPLTMIKLTHECFRFALPRMVKLVFALDGTNVAAVDHMVEEAKDLFCTYIEHAKAEDELILPAVRRYFPELCEELDNEHDAQCMILEKMIAAVNEYSSNPGRDVFSARPMLAVLRAELPGWKDKLEAHMRSEEVTVLSAARKYLPIKRQGDLVSQMWDLTTTHAWNQIMPFVIRHLPVPLWKATYVNCFVWACPERAQEFGMTIYRGTDSVTWCYLAKHAPEIIPRGVKGHKKMI